MAMVLAILLCVLSIRILPVHGNTLKTNFTRSLKFPQLTFKMSEEEPFLTLYNLAVKDCVYECKIRSACEAVNYWNVRRQCDLLESNTTILSDTPPGRPCVHVQKSDVRESPDMPLSSLCQGPCDHNHVCDVEAGNCTISECRAINQASIAIITGNPGNEPSIGIIIGNILSIGSLIRVSCKKWFMPDNYMYMRCQNDGNWHITTPCVSLFECGLPPEHPYAIASTHEDDGIDHVVVYECLSGYAAPEANSDMTIACIADVPNNGMWEDPGFMCIRNCSQPPAIENATVSAGDTLEGTTRNYTCIPGHVVNGTGPMTTTCQQNGAWTIPGFQCIPGACPPGWYQIDSSCYIVSSTLSILGSQIMTFCNSTYPYNTYMMQLESAEEDLAVTTFLWEYPPAVFCLGLHDPKHDYTWQWIATNEPLGFEHWCPTQPQINSEYNAGLFSSCDLLWKDFNSNYQCRPVCEMGLQ